MRYVRTVSKKIETEKSLTVPIYRFLVGVAGGGRDKDAASAMFSFIDKKLHADGWKTIFGEIEKLSTLLASPLATGIHKELSQEDFDKECHECIPQMIDIMRLISCSVVNPQSARDLSLSLEPIKQLFGLLLTGVSITLKGTHIVTALELRASIQLSYLEIRILLVLQCIIELDYN
jgi:hypothetical protein